jgi:AraC-like DNA-binding protein
MATGETTIELVNLCSRMMDLLDAPRDISFFSKLIQREIIYRLLQGSQGARLRAIATFETKCHRTAKAVAWLRSNYAQPLRVEHLATIAGMSRSTLHVHFRALTAMSPLQFQKQLRLHAARQRILTGELDAASAAFEVGYQIMFGKTHSFLPVRNGMVPNTAHILLHLAAAATFDLSSHEVRTAISSGSATRKLAPGRAVACSSTWFPTPRSASEVSISR